MYSANQVIGRAPGGGGAGDVMRTLAAVLMMAFAATPNAALAGEAAWTGFYIGANAGGAWSTSTSTLNVTDGPTLANCHFCNAGASDLGAVQGAGSSNFNPSGFVGGAQIGYNWQVSNIVFGLEADFESFSQHKSANTEFALTNNSATAGNCVGACVGNFSNSIKTDWLITIRPRFGYAWDRTLVYTTGGLALTRISFAQSYTDNIGFLAGPGGIENASASSTKAGWVIGGGIEHQFLDNWTLRAEYLYVRFGGLTASGRLSDPIAGDYSNFSNSVDHLSSNIVRIGLNYRFGATPATRRN